MEERMTGHDDDPIRLELTVTGVVQAVGFRPFVYRRATAHGLGGSVRNTGDAGVDIVLEGAEDAVDAFLEELRERPPPLSVVESIEIDRREPLEHATPAPDRSRSFEIAPSTDDEGGSGTIPPDTGICEACLEDVRDPDSRYHEYWATSCVDCGPRYTVIESLPYDRPRTTMEPFPLCADCHEEYTDPADRRYHAQTIACPECGPSLSLLDADRERRASGPAAIEVAADRLAAGELVAIRGIGGTHLACLATDRGAVDRLRDRTDRPAKPFALMSPSVEAVEAFATVGNRERELLTDVRRPIVVLETDRRTTDAGRTDDWLAAVAPGLHTVGVMLPYAGLHHLLFDRLPGPLVMTSANRPGRPMAITVEGIYEELAGVIDAALVHDREIVARCDDSVVRVVDGDRRFLRRSRGWVPRPLPRRGDGASVLALGAEFDAVVALARDDEVIPSQHIGDVDGPATEAFLEATVDHLLGLFDVEPSVVACDLHPGFLSSQLAESYAESWAEVSEPIRIGHHHAHAAGLLAEHDVDRAVVVAADGTGHGPDGTVWGGEVLDVTRRSCERIGGLDGFRLPGGEAAVRYPARILASLLDDEDRIDRLVADRTPLAAGEAATVREVLAAGVNAPETTSAGRFLDAIAALIGVGSRRRYQGEPAIRLEAAAAGTEPTALAIPYGERGCERVVDVRALADRLDALTREEPPAVVAATAQDALARGLATIAVEGARARGVEAVGFTGGVAYNDAISRRIRETVEAAGLRHLSHERIPPGDAGIAYGQAIVATARTS